MYNLDKLLKDNNLTEEQYEELLKDCSKKVFNLIEDSWDDISKKYDLCYSGESLRKASQLPLVGGVFVKEYVEAKKSAETITASTQQDIEALEQAKVRFRDARNAFNKKMRDTARKAEDIDLLHSKLEEIRLHQFVPEVQGPKYDGERHMIVCLSDLHVGQEFYSRTGSYNTDIAKNRIDTYFYRVCEIGRVHGVDSVTVVGLGDQISGNIHKTIQLQNRENVIEQVKTAVTLIGSFVRSLCGAFASVDYVDVSGNHTRLDKKDDALHDERLDELIGWMVGKLCSDLDNFQYIPSDGLDNGIAEFGVFDRAIVAVHGDFDTNSSLAMSKLRDYLGYRPDIVLKGHLHSPAMFEQSNVTVIQSGSLCGSGDQYTLEKRLVGKPNQTVLVITPDGLDAVYNVSLDVW